MAAFTANPFADSGAVHTTLRMPTICIIGAGLTGLTCAQQLRSKGATVIVLDKGRAPGGRAATRYLSDRDQRCDVGAQFWTARDPAFAAATAEWVARGWAESWGDGFPILKSNGLHDGRDGHARWRAMGGMVALARHLAADIDVSAPRTVTSIEPQGASWTVTHVAGDAIRGPGAGAPETLTVDAVVFTQPVPQILALLAPLGVTIPPAIAAVRYDPCLYLLAERPDGEAVLPAPGGLRIEDPALGATWLASARRRGLRSTGDSVILHADAALSAAHWDDTPQQLQAVLSARLQQVLARLDVTWEPTLAEVRRWKYSRCTQTAPERYWQPVPGLLCAGDAFGDAPRIEGAWVSGMAAAHAL